MTNDHTQHLTLRDQLALSALPACITWRRHHGRDELIGDGEPAHAQPSLPMDPSDSDLSAVANAAYLFADAMIIARARRA